ncbi:hypothetical protein [Streptomyces albipurpureus]|uniref:Secreted protein n=1 Tax=Streptomyces albipurpureus TaxID=2897419 RepID=A0ABT0UWT1_9ACTN|nr:hypothetical protein [Streptomyces sp. CWNU-1]MCM2393042.1 hypothetical protein [Streptomyces sp. CWNU-1]
MTMTRGRGRLLGVLVLAAVLLATGAGVAKDRILGSIDGAFLNVVDDCEGTEAFIREIESLSVLVAPAPGTRPAPGYDSAEAGCLDDSGDEYLEASLRYEVTADKQAVSAHYRALAEKDGWKQGEPSYGTEDSADPADLCFHKKVPSGPVVLSVYFDTEKNVDVSVVSLLDGTSNTC